jgi:hypothetical protein
MMDYTEKLKIANDYLMNIYGFEWDDLPDINSLHDVETKRAIIELCKERIESI